jgi:hypothetical protein
LHGDLRWLVLVPFLAAGAVAMASLKMVLRFI